MPVFCLTGCDSVSSFRGHGKKTAFRFVEQKSGKYQMLSSLGDNEQPTVGQIATATELVGNLYGASQCTSLNKLRCERMKKKSVSARKLPPTDELSAAPPSGLSAAHDLETSWDRHASVASCHPVWIHSRKKHNQACNDDQVCCCTRIIK